VQGCESLGERFTSGQSRDYRNMKIINLAIKCFCGFLMAVCRPVEPLGAP